MALPLSDLLLFGGGEKKLAACLLLLLLELFMEGESNYIYSNFTIIQSQQTLIDNNCLNTRHSKQAPRHRQQIKT